MRVNADHIEVILRAVDTMSSGVVIVDEHDEISYANERALDILAPSSSTEVRVGEVEKHLAHILSDVAQAGDSGRGRCELENGSVIGSNVTSLEPPHEDSRVLVIQEISSIERLSAERDRLMQLAAVGDLLPSLLHELKNPLASVTARLELMLEETPEGQLQDDLHAVLSEVRRMGLGFDGVGLVGKQILSPRCAAIDHALRDACNVLKGQARNHGIHFEFEGIETYPLLALNVSVVRALILNLAKNAMEACHKGDTVSVASHFDMEESKLYISVSDTGGGMTPEVLEKCTSLFYSTKSKGSGIGLALCREVVETAGGSLKLESVLKQGTTVRIVIPLGICI